MKQIISRIMVLSGIVMICFLVSACSSDSVFVKKDKSNQKSDYSNNASVKEDYSYNDETDSEYTDKKSRDNNNIKNDQARDVASGGSYNENNRDNVSADDRAENDSYYQKGYASWYGREFHGRKTASGEKFDMNKLTAAHKKLPFGTKILVKNLENNKIVSVTVNDRGPYKDNRILDLSYAAAKKVGIIGSGQGMVGIKIVKGTDEAKNSSSDIETVEKNEVNPVAGSNSSEEGNSENSYKNDGGFYSIQAGAFYSRKNAEKFQKRVEGLIGNPVVLIKENDLYKVKIDNLTTKKDANKVKKMLESEEISSYVIENRK
ncbi:MAG: septal ring lytic transglycosylase RlpA family protein [Spirochaetota bacterium]